MVVSLCARLSDADMANTPWWRAGVKEQDYLNKSRIIFEFCFK